MAEVHGNAGSVTFTNLTAGTNSWTLSIDGDVHDTTDFADGTDKTYISGLKGWSATVEANWDSANSAAVGDSATLNLTVTGSSDYEGTAILTGVSVSTPVADVVTVTYTFQGTGALTIT